MILLQLFWSFFQVGLFSIGGGLAALPLIQYQIVDIHNWLTLTEFTDLVTIAEMTPGPIAINSATFVGTRMGGLLGALVATFGCILAPCIIVSLLYMLYSKYREMTVTKGILDGLRPAVVALIATAGFKILVLNIWGEQGFTSDVSSINYIAVILFAAAMFVLRKWKPNPIYVILGSGVIGGVVYLLT